MKLIGWMNGWIECPQCWRTFLLRPVRINRAPGWLSVSVLGFVAFFARRSNAPGTAQEAQEGAQPGKVAPTPCQPAKIARIA
jgi:hypothetical protein